MRHLALAALLLAGCSPPSATRLIVVVDSDYAPGTELQRVRIETFSSPDATMARDVAERTVAEDPGASAVTIPFSFAVVPDSESAREIALEITGTIADAPGTITRRVRTSFVAGTVAIVRVHLSRGCAAMTCEAPTTCERGACVDERIDATPAPGLVPGSELDAGAPLPPDAGPIDALPSDALRPDAGTVPLSCTPGILRPELVLESADFDVAFDGARYAMLSTSETGLRFQTRTLNVDVAAGSDLQRPDLEPHPGGWVASFASTAGTVASVIFVDTTGAGTMATPLYDLDAPTTAIAADDMRTVVVFSQGGISYGSYGPGMTWTPAQRLEASVVTAGPAIARAGSRFVVAWGSGGEVHAREALSGAGFMPSLQTHSERVGPLAHVRVALGPSDFAVVCVDEVAERPLSFARFVDGSIGAAGGVVPIAVTGAPVIGAAAIAIDDEGRAGVLVRTESGPGWQLWLAEVGTDRTVAVALLREGSAAGSRQWIWWTPDGWAIAFDEGPMVYTDLVTCD